MSWPLLPGGSLNLSAYQSRPSRPWCSPLLHPCTDAQWQAAWDGSQSVRAQPTYVPVTTHSFPPLHSRRFPSFKVQHHFYFLHQAFSLQLFPNRLISSGLSEDLLLVWHLYCQKNLFNQQTFTKQISYLVPDTLLDLGNRTQTRSESTLDYFLVSQAKYLKTLKVTKRLTWNYTQQNA